MYRSLIPFICCAIFGYSYFSAYLVQSQITLPPMVTLPPESGPAPINMSSPYAMNVYDQACLDLIWRNSSLASVQSSPFSAANENENLNGKGDENDAISKWIKSQLIVYVGAVALNSNNTCEVICQAQSLVSFSLLFGDEIRTRSVLIGRVYTTSMLDGSSCVFNSKNGTCFSGQCGDKPGPAAGGDGGESNTTEASGNFTEAITDAASGEMRK